MDAYQALIDHVAEINDILCAISVLTWDARTKMPPGGARVRGLQQATLARIALERFLSERTEQLLEGAEAAVAQDPPDSYRARAVRQTREAYEINRRIPTELRVRLAELEPISQQAWAQARKDNDFPAFAPYLKEMARLSRELADAIGYEEHPYDALLRLYEPGMTTARLTRLFDTLKAGLQPLLEAILASPVRPRTDFLRRKYPEDLQEAFALEIAQAFGYDLSRGRLDVTAHPFEISFTREDVRITTRYDRHFLPMALFGTMHETGHALYEQNIDPALTRTPLTTDLIGMYAAGGTSFGAHESQSRLWENIVGRSRTFWQVHFPRLKQYFPEQLADVDAETFYRAVNRVEPSLIRVEADEVTYNFHIMLRVELERAILTDELPIDELPAAWDEKMASYLGIRPPSDTLGVLQDVHWSTGLFGSFPTYTIGNVMSAQLFDAARRDVVGLDAALSRGDYAPLREWLTEHVYRHGRAYTPDELLQRATGSPLTVEPYLAYLREKFTEIYELPTPA